MYVQTLFLYAAASALTKQKLAAASAESEDSVVDIVAWVSSVDELVPISVEKQDFPVHRRNIWLAETLESSRRTMCRWTLWSKQAEDFDKEVFERHKIIIFGTLTQRYAGRLQLSHCKPPRDGKHNRGWWFAPS